MADAKLSLKCTNCEGRDFYLQDGLYFCEECNVQFANLVEMEYDEKINENVQSQSRIRLAKDKTKEDNLKGKQDLNDCASLIIKFLSLSSSSKIDKF